MNTEIFSLNSYDNSCNGYATLKRSTDSLTVGFSFKNLDRSLLCLYFDTDLHICGTLTPSRPYLEKTLRSSGQTHSFGVFCGTDCVAFNGSGKAFEQMGSYIKLHHTKNAGPASTPINSTREPQAANPQSIKSPSYKANSASPKNSACSLDYFNKNKDFFYSIINSSTPIDSLQLLMPWSKWVNAPDGYILGIIYDHHRTPLYICYGMQGKKNQRVPDDLDKYCRFITGTDDNGWWIIYQDPSTGEALALK